MTLRITPYWWEHTQSLAPNGGWIEPVQPLPHNVDVVIVGAGLTGTAAAHELATAGRTVYALDAGIPGSGASSRNAGMIGRYLKHSFSELMESRGLDIAHRYFSELRDAYDQCVNRITSEGLDCDFHKSGRFVGAASEKQRDAMFHDWELRAKYLNDEVEFVAHSDDEIGQGLYHGGIRILENGKINPARYVEAMRRRAERAGASIIGNTPVTSISGNAVDGFEITTPRGKILARDVLIATNGYSAKTAAVPAIAARLAPINATMIATEPLPQQLLASLWPRNRTYHDSRRDANYMQVSPDGKRLLFGGRTGLHRTPDAATAEALRREMVILFPQLRDAAVDFVWTGKCAATVDLFPHVGMHRGMNYALGYCFSGNAMAPYLGVKAAKRILGAPDAKTVFQQDKLPKMPWPARQEWAMPAVIHYYRWADRPTRVPAPTPTVPPSTPGVAG
ncbi:MAG: FAD-binding oxidoreductase [Sphingomonadales bacterium]|nr:FAD-binding oxidoreductase [Sphingomonadales bacterium]